MILVSISSLTEQKKLNDVKDDNKRVGGSKVQTCNIN